MNRVIERPVVSGWLEKKSGGKEGGPKKKWNDKWDKRWFALVGSQLAYYRSEDDYTKGKAPLGFVECAGAKLFLKEVKGTVFRFTILSEARELKLRAPTPTVYKLWADAITPLARTVSLLEGEEDGDDEVEDGDVPISGRGAAASVVNECTISGWLEKKSGGKEGSKKAALFEKWDKRWFALLGTQLVYHKSEKDQLAGNPPLGSIECFGAQCFLKEVKGTVFRFTIRSDTRELKLRASNAQEYQGWTRALGPLTNQRRMEESDRFGDPFSSRRDDDDDDDDDYLRDRASTDSWLDGTSGEHDNDDGVPRERSKTEQVHMPTRNTAALDRARAAQSHGNMFAASAPTPVASAAPPPKDFGRLRQASTADHGDLSGSSSDEGAGDGADGTASVEADTPAAVRLERAPSLDVLFTDYDDFSEQDEEETDPEGDEQGAQAAKTQQKHRSSSEVAGTGESARPRGGSFLSRLFGGGSNPFDSDGGANPFGSAAPSANSVPEAVGEHKASAKRPSSNVPSSASSSNPFGSEDPPVRRVSSASIDSSLAYPITEGAGTRPGSSLPSGTSSGGTAPFKIIIVGDSGVGKTSLLVRFLEGRYTGTERPTLAVDVSSASLDLGTSTVGLSLWDTAGQERFAPLSAPYFRKADGVIVVFDVGSRTSFTRVGTHWEEEIFYKADPDVTVLLVGAKADVPNDQRAVSTEEAQSLAEEKGWLYFETSAMTGVHVRDAFYLLACTVMNRLLEADPANILNDGKSMPPTQQRGFLLGQGAPGQKQGGCC